MRTASGEISTTHSRTASERSSNTSPTAASADNASRKESRGHFVRDPVESARSSLGNILGHAPGWCAQAIEMTPEAAVKLALGDLSNANLSFCEGPRLLACATRAESSLAKRSMDIVGSSLLLLFLAPLLILIALLIRLDSRGSVLFRQHRTGHRGVSFTILKFRTMTVVDDGDRVTQARLDDQRVTRIGRFLRRASLDEVPQFINVLRGEMSLIGPRPHAVVHDRFYASLIPSYYLRFLVTPGMTGLAQVCGSRGPTPFVEDMVRRVDLDLDYIENWSFKLDFAIFVQTIFNCPFNHSTF